MGPFLYLRIKKLKTSILKLILIFLAGGFALSMVGWAYNYVDKFSKPKEERLDIKSIESILNENTKKILGEENGPST